MKKAISLLIILSCVVALNSCQKFDFWDHDNPHHSKFPDGKIATDWYRLQSRILLERNSAFNGALWGYIGRFI